MISEFVDRLAKLAIDAEMISEEDEEDDSGHFRVNDCK